MRISLDSLQDFAAGRTDLPEGVTRFAVSIDGTESHDDIAKLNGSGAVMAMLEVCLHASLTRYVACDAADRLLLFYKLPFL